MKCKMKSSIKSHLSFIITAVLLLVVQWPYLFETPVGIHAWAQWDRYAIVLGFLENGFHLFHPHTFVYNHQFPSDWLLASSSTITAVDFPVHEWLVAFIMKLTGNNSIIIFKLYVIAFAMIGLFFWWKIALTLTGNAFKSIIALVFASASPVFLYYAGSTLPSIQSLAEAVTGIYFYVLFKKCDRISDFNIAIFWLTLATLTRTTFVIPLLSVFLVEIIGQLKNHHSLKRLIPGGFISVSALAVYFFYNRFLAASYGSMFLNELMPAKSIEQAKDCLRVMFENWKFEWATGWHYLLFAFIIVISFFKKKKTGNTHNYALFNSLKNWTIFCLIGCFMFFIAMLRQFPHHDYYFIDTFFLPLCMVFLLVLYKVSFENSLIIRAVIAVLLGTMIFKSNETIIHRQRDFKSDRFLQMIENFSGADYWLGKSGIPEDAGILVIDVPAPNPPFIFMKRKGFVVLSSNLHRSGHTEAALQFPFDFVVLESGRQNEINKHIPQLFQQFSTLASSDKLILLKRNPD